MPFLSWGVVSFGGGLSVTGGLTADVATITSAQAGPMLTITNTAAAPSPANMLVTSAAATDTAISLKVAGDTNNRRNDQATGRISLGSGAGATDTSASRSAAGVFGVTTGSFDVTTAGQGLRVAEGANAKQGTAVLVAGTVTVANTSVTASSRILLTSQADGGTVGFVRVSARVAGTSFTITSSSGTDTSTIAYQIFEPG